MKKIIIKSAVLLGVLTPLITFAQQKKDLKYVIGLVVEYLKYGIYLILALAVVMFVWNVYKYLIAGSDEANRTEAGHYIMWSLIGFFVILSIWGLVNILVNTAALDNNMPTNGIFGSFNSSSNTNLNPFNVPATGSNIIR